MNCKESVKKKWLSVGGLLMVTVIWGGGFVASDIALVCFRPFQIMVLRFLLATLIFGTLGIKTIKTANRKEIKAGFFMGIALFSAFALQIIGLQYTTPSKNAFLTALNVVIVPFISYIALKKRIHKYGIMGAVLSLMGVAVLSLNGTFVPGLGDFLTILCAIGFAFQIFLTGEFVNSHRIVVLNFVQMATAFFLSLFSLFAFGETNFRVELPGVVSVLYLGIVSTTICYFLQTACQKYVDETKAAIILSMESVFGTLFSILILHEVITGRMVLGCIMILAAVLISNSPGEKERENEVQRNHI